MSSDLAIIVMGVSGSGKTSLGEALAAALGLPFHEGDRLHPPANIAKMSAGIALTDDDRWPWLDAVAASLSATRPAIASCSALRRVYRDRLRAGAGGPVHFICVNPTRDELTARLAQRRGHFMPPSLLDSQLRTLELPVAESDVLILDGAARIEALAQQSLDWLAAGKREALHG